MFRATRVPPLSVLLDDLTTQDRAKVAKHLGISTRTLKRWQATDDAPRAALLALFYETRWGYSAMYTAMFNECRDMAGLVDCHRRENAALRLRIERLEALGNFGSANDPVAKPATAGTSLLDVVLERWKF